MIKKNIFYGKLDGDSVQSLSNKLDYSFNDLESRMNKVEEILDNTEFFTEYYTNYYDGCANASTPLSEEGNVAQLLESYGSYILNSVEVKEELEKEDEDYTFINDKRYFNKKINKELHVDAFERATKGEDGFEGGYDIIHFIASNDKKNIKRNQEPMIPKVDVQDNSEMGQVLSQYQKFLNYIDEVLRTGNTNGDRYKFTRNKESVVNDMLQVQKSFKGTISTRLCGFKETTDYFLFDIIDFTNPKHVLHCLRFASNKLEQEDDFSLLMFDLWKYIERTKLTDMNRRVLDLWQKGFDKTQIGQVLETNKMYAVRQLQAISNKVARVVASEGGFRIGKGC